MTRQTWTAIVSAAFFVVLATLLAMVHVPFVAWGPGGTINLLDKGADGRPALQVGGIATHPVTGQLRMTTVQVTRVDSHVSLPEALYAWLAPHHDVLPRTVVYPQEKSVDQVKQEEVASMDTSKQDAVVAALRAAKQPVTQMPMVGSVSASGPAHGKLQPGDLVQRVDQTDTRTVEQVGTVVRKHHVGEPVVFSVLRGGKKVDVTLTTAASNQHPDRPVVGIGVTDGYLYGPNVTYGIDREVVGPSAGLVFALGIYDMITPGDLVAGRSVAGTGTIDAAGMVGSIGGIQEKIAGAEGVGATIFLVPAGNCPDLSGVKTSMNLVKVAKLTDAVSALQALKDNPQAAVPHC